MRLMPSLVPNLSKQSHLDAVAFKATAEFAGELFLRGLEATAIAYDLALKDSLKNQDNIISTPNKPFGERSRLLHAEGRRDQFFRDFGPAQHLVASTVLAYATLDTILAEAVRLLARHAGISAPEQNKRGSTIKPNLNHLRQVVPNFSPLKNRDQTVMNDFTKIRNILIHQGYFVNDNDPKIADLKASTFNVDYFEIRPGFPILLRDHGVRHFVMICNGVIKSVADGVYHLLVSK